MGALSTKKYLENATFGTSYIGSHNTSDIKRGQKSECVRIFLCEPPPRHLLSSSLSTIEFDKKSKGIKRYCCWYIRIVIKKGSERVNHFECVRPSIVYIRKGAL